MKASRTITPLFVFSLAMAMILAVSFADAKKPGGGGGHGGGGQQACDGQPIEAHQASYSSSCNADMWIQIEDSTTVCDVICWLTTNQRDCPTRVYWIGGKVVVDPSAPNGFRFDPATVRVAEVTEEGSQTSICQIASNPTYYANAGRNWWISANLDQYQPL